MTPVGRTFGRFRWARRRVAAQVGVVWASVTRARPIGPGQGGARTGPMADRCPRLVLRHAVQPAQGRVGIQYHRTPHRFARSVDVEPQSDPR
jgi:hypothetical protein